MLKDCVLPASELAAKMVLETPHGSSCAIHKMFRYVEAGLGYQYMSSWDLILAVIAQFFEVCEKVMPCFLTTCSEILIANLNQSVRKIKSVNLFNIHWL